MAREWSERHIRELIARQAKSSGGGQYTNIDWYDYVALGKFKVANMPPSINSASMYIGYGPDENGNYPADNKCIAFIRSVYTYASVDSHWAIFGVAPVDSVNIVIKPKIGTTCHVVTGIDLPTADYDKFMRWDGRKTFTDKVLSDTGIDGIIGTWDYDGRAREGDFKFSDNNVNHNLPARIVIKPINMVYPIVFDTVPMLGGADYTVVFDAEVQVGGSSDTLPNIDQNHFKNPGGI